MTKVPQNNINKHMKNLTVIVAALFSLVLASCNKEKPYCGPNSEAVWMRDPVCGCYDWVCMPVNNPCNTCNPNPPCTNCNPDTTNNGGGGGTVTYDNYHGSVYETALLTSTATQNAFAFEQGTGNLVLENSGNPMTSPKLYILDINPWNGTNFYPTANNGQALITNFTTSQGQGLYNRLVSELQQTAKATALANTVTYINTGVWNANYYYVVVKLRKNADGSPVGKSQLGTYVYAEITSYEIVRGTNSYFY